MLVFKMLCMFLGLPTSNALRDLSDENMDFVVDLFQQFGVKELLLISSKNSVRQIKHLSRILVLAAPLQFHPSQAVGSQIGKIGVLYLWEPYQSNSQDILNAMNLKAKWLIMTAEDDYQQLYNGLNTTSVIAMDTNILIVIIKGCKSNATCKGQYTLQQVYRTHRNASLTLKKLSYDPNINTTFDFAWPEQRKSDGKYNLIVGVKNDTSVDSSLHHRLAVAVEREETLRISEILTYIFHGINASFKFTSFAKLGWRNEEGGWNHLLGGVVAGVVDVAADIVDFSVHDIEDDVDLTQPILLTMSNVYVRRPTFGRNRDILLTTFSLELLASVIITTVLLWVAMLAITFTLYHTFKYLHRSGHDRPWELSEAFLWIIGVLCMQGSPWSPKSVSGCMLLFVSLIFALIIYNSFAAFVTSMLSVKDNAIRNLNDLLDNKYTFGYTQTSGEETYLRTTDDSVIRTLYYRGLVQGGGVGDVAEGMARTTNESFAFFASGRIARRALRVIVPQRFRCQMLELPIRGTMSFAAIPVSKSSAHTKLIRYWLLRLRENGILQHIRAQLKVAMPICSGRQSFNGASFTDLFTAYVLYCVGLISSVVILFMEILWSKKGNIFYWSGRKRDMSVDVRHGHNIYDRTNLKVAWRSVELMN